MLSRIVDLAEGFERKLELADRLREVLSEEEAREAEGRFSCSESS